MLLARASVALVAALLATSLTAVGCAAEPDSPADESAGELRGATSMLALLAQVPPGTKWKNVKPSIRAALERNAEA